MKFDCGEEWQEKKARLVAWHVWFAWHPVKVAPHDCRWLETIERRGEYYSGYNYDGPWTWEYRAHG